MPVTIDSVELAPLDVASAEPEAVVELASETVSDTVDSVELALSDVVPDAPEAVDSVGLALSDVVPDAPEAVDSVELTPEVVSGVVDPAALAGVVSGVVDPVALAAVVSDANDEVMSVEPVAVADESGVEVISVEIVLVVGATTITSVVFELTETLSLVGTKGALDVTATGTLELSTLVSGAIRDGIGLPIELDDKVVRLSNTSVNEWLSLDDESEVVLRMVVGGAIGEVNFVTVALEYDLLTSRGKYILRLATGSALASVEAATSAATKIDFVCILPI